MPINAEIQVDSEVTYDKPHSCYEVEVTQGNSITLRRIEATEEEFNDIIKVLKPLIHNLATAYLRRGKSEVSAKWILEKIFQV